MHYLRKLPGPAWLWVALLILVVVMWSRKRMK